MICTRSFPSHLRCEVATAGTKLAVIDRSRFLFLVQETPMFALQVMSSIAKRLRAAETS
jgi:CRP-like cAMP-binding protein